MNNTSGRSETLADYFNNSMFVPSIKPTQQEERLKWPILSSHFPQGIIFSCIYKLGVGSEGRAIDAN
jgi:hypothetical protein